MGSTLLKELGIMAEVECRLGNIPEGGMLESLVRGSRGGGTTPGEVKLESRLSHTVGRGTPIFPKPPEILSMS